MCVINYYYSVIIVNVGLIKINVGKMVLFRSVICFYFFLNINMVAYTYRRGLIIEFID